MLVLEVMVFFCVLVLVHLVYNISNHGAGTWGPEDHENISSIPAKLSQVATNNICKVYSENL